MNVSVMRMCVSFKNEEWKLYDVMFSAAENRFMEILSRKSVFGG